MNTILHNKFMSYEESLIGKKLNDQYEIVSILGRGTMGTVFLGEDSTLHRTVAIKILKPEYSDNDKLMARFKVEAENLASLTHPNIMVIYQFGFDRSCNIHYIIMEYIDGVKLSDIIEKNTLSWIDSLYLIRDILGPLEFAHIKNITHRDIKFENIMVDYNGNIKIVDFGLSKCLTDNFNENISNNDDLIGTPFFLAPELWNSSNLTSTKSDIFSLGVMWYKMITDKHPYGNGKTIAQVYANVYKKAYIPSYKYNSEIPHYIDSILNKMLEKDPKYRINSTDLKTRINTKIEELELHQDKYMIPHKDYLKQLHNKCKNIKSDNDKPLIAKLDVSNLQTIITNKKVYDDKLLTDSINDGISTYKFYEKIIFVIISFLFITLCGIIGVLELF